MATIKVHLKNRLVYDLDYVSRKRGKVVAIDKDEKDDIDDSGDTEI